MSVTTYVVNYDPRLGGGVGMASHELFEIFKGLANYYNAKTTCFEGYNVSACWECNGQSGNPYGSPPDWLGCATQHGAFVDSSGVAYLWYNKTENAVIIDVNGKRKPNKLGRDRFVFRIGYNLEPDNQFPSYLNTVLPWADIVEKTRWCPDGECYYRTWLTRNK